jgi:hypothetical protein
MYSHKCYNVAICFEVLGINYVIEKSLMFSRTLQHFCLEYRNELISRTFTDILIGAFDQDLLIIMMMVMRYINNTMLCVIIEGLSTK